MDSVVLWSAWPVRLGVGLAGGAAIALVIISAAGAVLLITKSIPAVVAGLVFASALAIMGVLSRGFRFRLLLLSPIAGLAARLFRLAVLFFPVSEAGVALFKRGPAVAIPCQRNAIS